MGASGLCRRPTSSSGATADPGSLLSRAWPWGALPRQSRAFSPGKSVFNPRQPHFVAREGGTVTFVETRAGPGEKLPSQGPQLHSLPRWCHCPPSCGLTGHCTSSFLSEPRLVSRGQWRPQVLLEGWAQWSFYRSVPGKSLASHPQCLPSLLTFFPGLSCRVESGGGHQAVDKAELC